MINGLDKMGYGEIVKTNGQKHGLEYMKMCESQVSHIKRVLWCVFYLIVSTCIREKSCYLSQSSQHIANACIVLNMQTK